MIKVRFIRKGFTMVELLIAVAIIAVLSGGAYIGYHRVQRTIMNNKVTADLSSIQNALEQFRRDDPEGKYPIPSVGEDKNLLCFYLSTAYAHDCATADFIQGQIDNNLLTKRYLQEVPTDPRTQSRYAYGVTADGLYYQIAGLIENEDGTFTAQVAEDLHFTYPVKSLIRSFNGPEFVLSGEGWLPYSPDHLSITAFMADITGTVNVNGSPVTPASPDEEKTVRPGSKVQTAPASFVTLYFSDGSVTYLGDPTQASELWITPGTEVNQNDKDGIITKIRLKLFSGKIWNKVARLASESEFNVETTAAIAGVRGTEFGIDALLSQIVVRSGTVAARRTTPDDYTSAAEEAGYITFDSADIISVTPAADGTFKSFYIPDGAGTIPAGTPVSNPADYERYYLQSYSNSLEPRINEIDVASNVLSFRPLDNGKDPHDLLPPSRILAFDENDLLHSLGEPWQYGQFTVDPVTGVISINNTYAHLFFGMAEDKTVLFVFEDEQGNRTAFSHPPILIQPNTLLTWEILFGDEVASSSGGGGGQCTGTVESIIMNTFPIPFVGGTHVNLEASAKLSPSNCLKDISTECQWTITPTIGTLIPPNDLVLSSNVNGEATITCYYEGKSDSKTLNVITPFHKLCAGDDKVDNTSDDNGYWQQPACWVLGEGTGKDCNDACTALGSIAKCDNVTAWNDDTDCTICKTLISPIVPTCGTASTDKAPFFLTATNACRYRNTSIVPNPKCETDAATNEKRICSCVTQ